VLTDTAAGPLLLAGGAAHEYSFFPSPHNTRPTIYGSADVLHVLYGVNQLNLSATAKAAWCAVPERFRRPN
jgi:hypothetical protein